MLLLSPPIPRGWLAGLVYGLRSAWPAALTATWAVGEIAAHGCIGRRDRVVLWLLLAAVYSTLIVVFGLLVQGLACARRRKERDGARATARRRADGGKIIKTHTALTRNVKASIRKTQYRQLAASHPPTR